MIRNDIYPKPLSPDKFKDYFYRYKSSNDKEAEEILIAHNM